jgi:transposase
LPAEAFQHIFDAFQQRGVTLELLHLEYLEQHPDGYRYTQFCEVYRRWVQRRGLSMRQVHRAGAKLFVDYAGKKPTLIEATTGEVIAVELFVAALGASNYTYAEATRTQQVPDWVASHQRAFAFFGGATEAIVPDQFQERGRGPVSLRARRAADVRRLRAARREHRRDKDPLDVTRLIGGAGARGHP